MATRFPAGPASSPGFLLWHVTLRWQRMMSATLAPLGLTHVQFVLLACTWWLNERGSAPSQLAVSAMAGTDVRMTSQVLRKLEARALLSRERDRRDARARALRVTAAGAALAASAVTAVETADAAFFAAVPGGELTGLLRQLAGV